MVKTIQGCEITHKELISQLETFSWVLLPSTGWR